MVRLEESKRLLPSPRFSYFNSKMVRLEAVGIEINVFRTSEFQFQDGTIRSMPCVQLFVLIAYFNSKMVRLEVYI